MLPPVIRAIAAAAALVAGLSVTAVIAAPRMSAVPGIAAIADASPIPASAPAGLDAAAGSASPGAGLAQAGGDVRSTGEGAGLAGSPLAALGTVLAIGAGSAALTLVYVRLTAGRSRPPRRSPWARLARSSRPGRDRHPESATSPSSGGQFRTRQGR